MKYHRFCLLSLTVFALFQRIAGAVEIHVPEDYATIQAAIDSASDGDVILIADGIWSGSGNLDLDPGGKAVCIQSESGNPELCIISGSDLTRGFRCDTSETSSTIISGLTIRNTGSYGSLPFNGAGISCTGASPSITNCRFLHCDAESTPNGPGVQPAGSGGGIDCDEGSSPIITGCLFENCRRAISVAVSPARTVRLRSSPVAHSRIVSLMTMAEPFMFLNPNQRSAIARFQATGRSITVELLS